MRPGLSTTSGNGPPAATGVSRMGVGPLSATGYQTSVTRVRSGAPGSEPRGGVGREVSTSVNVRTPTPKGPGARNASVVACAGQRADAAQGTSSRRTARAGVTTDTRPLLPYRAATTPTVGAPSAGTRAGKRTMAMPSAPRWNIMAPLCGWSTGTLTARAAVVNESDTTEVTALTS